MRCPSNPGGVSKVIHIPLDSISYGEVIQLQKLLETILQSSGVRLRHTRPMKFANVSTVTEPCDSAFDEVLSKLWTSVVKPVLDGISFTVGQLL
jgi:hypothetical protein